MKTALNTFNKNWISSLQKIAEKFTLIDVSKIEKIGVYARQPETSICTIIILSTKQQAIRLAKIHGGNAVFVDNSSKNNMVDIKMRWKKIG